MSQILHQKYNITKTDGSPVDPNAMYFVFRLDTDDNARFAFMHYVNCVRGDDPKFADELFEYLRHAEKMSHERQR